MSLKTATVITVSVAVIMLGAISCVLVLGTLFFDDPHASYGDFIAGLSRLAAVVVITTATCLSLGRLLSRSGHTRPALVVVLLPTPLMLAYLVYAAS